MADIPRTRKLLTQASKALLTAQARLLRPGIERDAWITFEEEIGQHPRYTATAAGMLRLVGTRLLDYSTLWFAPSSSRLGVAAGSSLAIMGVLLLGLAPLPDDVPRWTHVAFAIAAVAVGFDGWRRRFNSSRLYMAKFVATPLVAASLGQALNLPIWHPADGPIVVGLWLFAVGGAMLVPAVPFQRLYRPAIAVIAGGGVGILVGDFMWFLIFLPSAATSAWLGSLLAAIGSGVVTWSLYQSTRALPVLR
jgi:hypothetical protein